MGVLTYSAISKTGKIISDQFSAADSTKIVSLKVPIEYDEINLGSVFEIDLGELPAGCVLLHGQVTVDTIFRESVSLTSPFFSVGLKNPEYEEIDFPVPNYKGLIFDNLELNMEYGSFGAQGPIVESRTTSRKINEIDNSLMVSIFARGSWSAGGDLSGPAGFVGSCGEQASGLSFGGYYTNRLSSTEEYNGTSWSAGGALGTAVYLSVGCGIQTAALSFGGNSTASSYTNVTEDYNGSTWSTTGNLNVARRYHSGFGTQTAAVCTAGQNNSAEQIAGTEEFNGATWSSANDLVSARVYHASAGLQAAGLTIAGNLNGVYYTETELYNGSVWSVGNNINNARSHLGGCGTQNDALIFGGYDGESRVTCEEFDGTSWYDTNDLSAAKQTLGSAGQKSSGLCFGGFNGTSYLATTEEYDPTSLANLNQGSMTLFLTYSYQ